MPQKGMGVQVPPRTHTFDGFGPSRGKFHRWDSVQTKLMIPSYAAG